MRTGLDALKRKLGNNLHLMSWRGRVVEATRTNNN